MGWRLASVVVLGCTTVLCPTVFAQGAPSAPGALSVGVLAPDASFVLRVADHEARRLEAARLAATRAMAMRVRALAERMTRDHRGVAAEVAALARARSIPLKTDPGVAKLVAHSFAGLTGERFDAAYVGQAVTELEATIALVQDESRAGQDAELRTWAGRLLPILREHLRLARALATP